MAVKYLSNRVKDLKVGISNYSESKTSVSVVGGIGIGTADTNLRAIYAIGNAEVVGILTATSIAGISGSLTSLGVSTLNVTGVSTFSDDVSLTDNTVLQFGDSKDLKIYHTTASGGYSAIVDEGTGQLAIGGNIIEVKNAALNATYATIDGSGIDVTGHTETDTFNVSGVSTLGITSATDLEAQQLKVSGLSTFVGVSTFSDDVFIAGELRVGDTTFGSDISTRNLNVSGVSTFTGIVTTGNDLYVGGDLYVSDDITIDELTARNLNVSGVSTFAGVVNSTVSTGTAPFVVASTTKVANLNADLLDGRDTSSSGGNNIVMVTDGSGNSSLGSGTFTSGTLKVGTAITAHAGIITATTFDGNLATTNLTGTITNAQLAGSIANNKLVNDSVSYGGVEVDLGSSDATPAFNLTDATNYPYTSLTGITTTIVGDTTPQLGGNLDGNSKSIFGVGVLTATSFSGTLLTAAQTNITSLGTLSAVTVSGDINANGNIVGDTATNISGINQVTATTFVGDGSGLTNLGIPGISTAGTTELNDLDLSGNLNVAGVSTFAGDLTISSTFPRIYLTDTNSDSDFSIFNGNGTFTIKDETNATNRIRLFSGGGVQIDGNLDATAGLDVTGHTGTDTLKVTGISTLTGNVITSGDVQFTGASYNAFWDKSVNALQFSDNAKATWGDHAGSGDLQIYHSGSHSYIKDSGTGALVVNSDNFYVNNAADTQTLIHGAEGGAVKIYHNNSERFRTTGIGVSVIGAGAGRTAYIEGPDEIWIDPHPYGVGQTSGMVRIRGDLYVDGTEFIVDVDKIELGDFQIGIATTAGTNALLDGAGIGIGSTGIRKFITWNNATSALMSSENWNLASGKHYEIAGTDVLTSTTLGGGVVNSSLTSVGTLSALTVSGTAEFDGQVNFDNADDAGKDLQWQPTNDRLSFFDNVKATFGDSVDMQLYHNGSWNYIDNIATKNFVIRVNGTDNALVAIPDGKTSLYYSGDEKIQTTNTGAIVTGILTASSFSGGGISTSGTSQFTNLKVTGVSTFTGNSEFGAVVDVAGDLAIADTIRHIGDSNTKIRFPAADTVSFETAGSERLRITSDGKVGIGTDGPQVSLHVENPTGSGKLKVEGQANGDATIVLQGHGSGKPKLALWDTLDIGKAHITNNDIDGSTWIRIANDGKVGINEDTPTAKLHIVEATSTPGLKIKCGTNTNQNTHITMYNDNDIPLNLGVFGSGATTVGTIAANTAFMSSNSAGGVAINASNASGVIKFGTGSSETERLRIDDSGRTLIGHTASLSEGCLLQVARANDNTVELFGYSANANGARINFTKSRNATIGTNTIVQDGDTLGELHFRAANGVDQYYRAAAIEAEIDGTPGASSVPGRLIFSTTASGATTQTERLRITSAGQVQINRDGGSAALTLGVSQDFKMYHDAGGPTIFSDTGNQGFKLQIKELNLTEYTGGTTRLKLDSSGQIGVGNVTPKTWQLGRAVHIGNAENAMWGEADYALHMIQNAYYNSGYKKVKNAKSTLYTQSLGKHSWYTSVAAAADAANVWTEVMRIDDDGKVGIGTNAPDVLLHAESSGSTGITFEGSSSNTNHISGDAGTYLILKNKSATDNNFSNILGVDAGGQATSQISFISEAQSTNAGVLAFATRVASGSMTERLRINSNGVKVIKNGNLNISSTYIDFSGDVSTPSTAAAIYRPADNTLAFSTANVERLRIDSSGNVGIGTDDTSLYNNTSGNGIMMRGGQVIDIARDNDLQLTLNRLTADGANIGLYQAGALKGTIGTKSGGIYFGTGGDTERLRIHSTGQLELKVPDANPCLILTPSGTNAPATINFNTPGTGPAVFKVQGSEKLRIASDGKVGIGTVNPTSLLHLTGSAPRITLTDTAGTDDYAKIFSTGGSLYFQQRDGSAHGNIIFRTENSSTAAERLRIKSDGNIIPGTNNSTSIGDGTTNFASIWASTRFRGNDDVKLILGSSQDLVIRHDGSYNIIGSPVGGDLHIKSGTGDNDNQLIAAFKHSNACVGIGTTNPSSLLTLDHATNPAIQFRDSGTKVASINAEGTQTNIASFESKDLVFAASTSSAFTERLRIASDGAWGLGGTNYGSSGQVLTSNGSGSAPTWQNSSGGGGGSTAGISTTGTSFFNQLVVSGISTFSDTVEIPSDSKKILLGADKEMQVFHNGTDSLIKDTRNSGTVKIQADNFSVIDKDAGQTMLTATVDGAVKLRHSGNIKLETTDTGVKIPDAILEIADTTCLIDLMETSATNHRIRNGSGNFYIQKISDDKSTTTDQLVIDGGTGETALYFSGSEKLKTTNTGIFITGVCTATTFYGDGSQLTGTGGQALIQGITVQEEGSTVGTGGSIRTLDFVGGNITASASGTKATVALSDTPTFDSLSLTNTDTGSSAGPIIDLYRNSASPADADYLGQIKFQGENDAGQKIVYSKITGKILDASDGTEDGILEFAFQKAGTNNISGRFRSDSLQLLNGTNFTVAGDTTLSGSLTIPAVSGTNNNASQAVLFQTAAGIVDGGSGLTYNPANDQLSVNGNLISSQQILGATTQLKLASSNSSSTNYITISDKIEMKGNVGIGTDNPENGLHVSDGSSYAAPQNTGAGKVMIEHASSADLQFMTANSGYNHIFFGDQDDANIGSIVYHHASNANAMVFNTNTAEALRITSTGLLQATSGQHDGGLHLLSGNNNQSTSLRLQAKSSGGTSYDWYLDSARSTDRFSISDGTTSWLTILGDGKVGINTVIPGTEFEVLGSGTVATFKGTGGNAFIGIQDVDSGNSAFIGNEDGGLVFQTPSSSYSTKMTITHSGDVGIGITNPTNTLVLKETDPVLVFRRNFGSGTSDIGSINFGNNNIDSDLARITVEGDGATDNAAIVFKTQATGNAVTERLRITSTGEVGIGLTNPESFNASANQLVIQDSGACGLTIDATSSTNSSVFFADGATGNEAYRGWVQYEHSNDDLTLGTAAAERLRIHSGGNVAIGTDTDSTQRLGIYGTNAAVVTQNSSTGTGNGNGFYMGNGNGTVAYLWNYENEAIRFATNNTEKFRVDQSGRVVISNNAGGHAGGSQFVVMGGAINNYASAAFGNYTAAPTSGTTFAMFRFNSGSTGTSRGAEIIAAADANWTAGSSYPTRLIISTTASGATSSTERLRITSVGICSITTPGNTADGTYYSTVTINNTGSSTWSRLRFDRSGVAKWGLSLGTDDTFRISNLYTGGSSASPDDDCFVIANSSKVGIGSDVPTEKLDVAGTVKANGVSIIGNAYGIEFKTASANSSNYIKFNDHSSSDDGRIQYEHSTDEFLFLTGTSWRARLHADYFKPETTNEVDLGVTGQRFKNLWLSGNANIADDKSLNLGNDSDLYIKHSNGHAANFIVSSAGEIEHHMASSKKIIKGFQNSGTPYVNLYHNDNIKLTTTSAGITVTGTATATDFDSTSDIRLKTNIEPIDDPLAKVIQIEGVSFNWKEDNKPALGVIADQVEEIIPEIVRGGPDTTKTVNYNGLIGLLIEAVKEQQTQIDGLKERLSKLE